MSTRESARLLQVDACADCDGTGRAGAVACPECRGAGSIDVERSVRVRIPAGVEDGQSVRVRGEGLPDANGEPGDAFIVVRVAPPPLERRLLRYAAVAGVLVALALIVWLLLGI